MARYWNAVSDMTYAARLRVGPGDGRLIRTASECLFVPNDEGADPRLVAAFLASFRNAEDSEQIIGDFVLEHQTAAPAFAWLAWAASGRSDGTDDGIRLMVRGDVTVTTDVGSVPTLSGAGSTTWVEHRVRRSPDSADIHVGTTASDFSDLAAGTVAAGGFRLVLNRATSGTGSTLREAADPGSPSAQVVAGRRCPSDHANPPHLVWCRICDLAVDQDAETVTVRSPVLAVARLADGTAIDIAGTVVLGRQPQSERTRLSVPHDLVPVAAPSSVSRTHAVIAATGWAMTVTDCDSRSGTVLVDSENLEPIRLEPWMPHELGTGDVIHLGGSTTVTIGEPVH